jgi:hypothetical protein
LCVHFIGPLCMCYFMMHGTMNLKLPSVSIICPKSYIVLLETKTRVYNCDSGAASCAGRITHMYFRSVYCDLFSTVVSPGLCDSLCLGYPIDSSIDSSILTY